MDDGMQWSERLVFGQRRGVVCRRALAAAPLLGVCLALSGCWATNAQQHPAAGDAAARQTKDSASSSDAGDPDGGRGVPSMKPGDASPVPVQK